MKLRYVGPHEAVRVPLPGGGEATIAHGEVLDTTDTHGEGLLEQAANWELTPERSPKDSTSKPATGKEV